MTSRRNVLGLAVLCLGTGAVFALIDPETPLTRFRDGKPFRIGYAVEPPYAFLLADGTVTGEAPEIAQRIARQIGISTIEWRQMEFGELLDALEARQIDVIAAGMFITPERQRRALFSQPTIHVRPGLLVVHGNPKGIASYHQVAERTDLRIAVLSDAVEEQIMRHLGVSEIRLLRVPDALSGRRAVETGLADALLLSEPTVRWMARTEQLGHTEMLVALTDSSDVYGATAFAFRLDAGSVREAWNAALRQYLGSPDHRALLAELGLSCDPQPDPGAPR